MNKFIVILVFAMFFGWIWVSNSIYVTQVPLCSQSKAG